MIQTSKKISKPRACLCTPIPVSVEQKIDCTPNILFTVSEMVSWGPKNCRSKIFPFLYSLGHTEAKKIPEYFFHWYHLACFFQMKILKKFFLAKTHQEGPKIGCSQKNFFCKMTRKTLRKFHTHCKNLF